jgi:hypothetical protein
MNPFADETFGHRATCLATSQLADDRAPRGMRSLSRIEGMTVGDVRQCFSQMRATPRLTADTTLWCGITAGHFALRYLVNTACSSRKRRVADSADGGA